MAQATGVRPIGGVVLAAGAAWCGLRWRADAGLARAVLLLAVYAAGFVASHLLAGTLGAWGSVLAVATVVGLASAGVADRRRVPQGAGGGGARAHRTAPTGTPR